MDKRTWTVDSPGIVLPASAATNAGVGVDIKEKLDRDPDTVLQSYLPQLEEMEFIAKSF